MQYPLTCKLAADQLNNSFLCTRRGWVDVKPEEINVLNYNLTTEQLLASEIALEQDTSLGDRYWTESSNGYEHPATDLVLNKVGDHHGLY